MSKPVDYQITENSKYGYKHLDPIPDAQELANFYESQYYHLLRQGDRAPELRKLLEGGESAAKERAWLHATLYTDISAILQKYSPGQRLLDIGCGTGEFISFLQTEGFDVCGTEPSVEAAAIAQENGLTVYGVPLGMFCKNYLAETDLFDVATLINVLEHVPDPVKTLEAVKQTLKPGGMICIRVPNDFSEIQLAAQTKLQSNRWWVAFPDHINYFDFQSLNKLLTHMGFTIMHEQGDFPMEFFLLMGDNYTGDPEMGNICHQKRVELETSLSGDLRRRLYKSFAASGIGRNCLTFAVLSNK